MIKLEGFQKKYLRGLAHNLKPIVFIGQKGLADSVVRSVSDALGKHELIKIKFIEYKEKSQKKEIVDEIEKKTDSEMVGMVGHTAIFFRQHPDLEKQKILVPKK
jgi:RNA-binding protein